MKQRLKKNLFGYITVAICAGILIYFLMATGGITELLHLFTTLRARWLWAALAAALAVWVLEGAAVHVISSHVYEGWTFKYSLSAGMIGFLYSAITPFSTGGQPMQIYALQKNGMTTGAASAIVAVRSLMWQVSLVVFSLIMVILRLSFFAENVSSFTFLLLIGLFLNLAYVAFLILVMRSPKATNKVVWFFIRLLTKLRICRDPEGRFDRIHAQLTLFHENVAHMGKAIKMYVLSFLITFSQFVCQCLIPYFLYVAFFYDKSVYPAKDDIITVMAAQAFVLMVSYFIPTPGASGGAELSFYGFFHNFYERQLGYSEPAASLEQVTQAKLTSAMFLWRFISFYLTIIAGSLFAAQGNRLKPLTLKNKLVDENALVNGEGGSGNGNGKAVAE